MDFLHPFVSWRSFLYLCNHFSYVLLWSCVHVVMNDFIILSWALEYSPSLCLLCILHWNKCCPQGIIQPHPYGGLIFPLTLLRLNYVIGVFFPSFLSVCSIALHRPYSAGWMGHCANPIWILNTIFFARERLKQQRETKGSKRVWKVIEGEAKEGFQGETGKDRGRGRVADSQASIPLTSSCQLFTSLEAPSLWKLETNPIDLPLGLIT